MSSLIVKVRTIDEIIEHPNADRLEIVLVGSWRCVTGKGQFKVGDKVVYFPPDSVMSREIADKFGITKYLASVRGEKDKLRVRATRLRTEPSFGTVQPCEQDWEIGTDLAEFYGITKWEPPLSCVDGDAAKPTPAFHKYTGIENYGNFPDVFTEGEEIVINEKIHGQNCRIGLIRVPDEQGNESWELMAGSHEVRRKPIDAKGRESDFWKPVNDNMKNLLYHICDKKYNVIIFGELLGTQDMKYGLQDNTRDFRAFDISIDGKYMDHEEMKSLLDEYNIPIAPILYVGPYNRQVIEKHTDGLTTVCNQDEIKEKFKGREGIVFRPTKEQFCSNLPGEGRKILKSVSVDYHDRKNKNQSEEH